MGAVCNWPVQCLWHMLSLYTISLGMMPADQYSCKWSCYNDGKVRALLSWLHLCAAGWPLQSSSNACQKPWTPQGALELQTPGVR